MPLDQPAPTPIFILGIMPRCGTNFLSNLLQIHPDCAAPEVVWEDYSVAHADQLVTYSDTVAGHWDPDWGVTEQTQADFDAALGLGISRFLHHGRGDKRVVAKTPNVENLDLFFRFFPGVPLLILIRDGRSIVESGMQSFGWNREAALHWLAGAAKTIGEFQKKFPQDEHNYRIVHYEDLWRKPVETMREVLEFLGLNAAKYDFEQASQLPVRGSSEMLDQDDAELHWDPVEKTEEFDPLSRHRKWTGYAHHRFHQVTGRAMAPLGYVDYEPGAVPWTWALRSNLLDGLWSLKALIRPLYRRLRRNRV